MTGAGHAVMSICEIASDRRLGTFPPQQRHSRPRAFRRLRASPPPLVPASQACRHLLRRRLRHLRLRRRLRRRLRHLRRRLRRRRRRHLDRRAPIRAAHPAFSSSRKSGLRELLMNASISRPAQPAKRLTMTTAPCRWRTARAPPAPSNSRLPLRRLRCARSRKLVRRVRRTPTIRRWALQLVSRCRSVTHRRHLRRHLRRRHLRRPHLRRRRHHCRFRRSVCPVR